MLRWCWLGTAAPLAVLCLAIARHVRAEQTVVAGPHATILCSALRHLLSSCPQAHFFEAGTDVFSKTLGTPAFMGGCSAGRPPLLLAAVAAAERCCALRCQLACTDQVLHLPAFWPHLLQHRRCGLGSNTTACPQTCGLWESPSTPSSLATCPSRQASSRCHDAACRFTACLWAATCCMVLRWRQSSRPQQPLPGKKNGLKACSELGQTCMPQAPLDLDPALASA